MAGVALLAAVGWAYHDTLAWILEGWRENPYYSHGPLVPVITAGLLWRARGAIAGAEWRHDRLGLVVVAGALGLFVLGRVMDVNAAVGLSLVVLIHGVALALAGPAAYRPAALPLAFLVFAVPLSQLVVHHYSFPLQLVSARLASALMALLTGADAHAAGTIMRMDRQDYVVAAECSGFKALLGLTMVGVLIAYLTDTTPRRRVLIAVLAAPIAVASNIVRLFGILVAGRVIGHQFAVTTFHDLSGLLMLVVAIAILLGAARLVVGPEADVAGAPPPSGTGGPVRVAWQPLASAAVIVLLGGALGLALVPPPPPPPEVDLTAVPLTIGAWQGVELPIDPRVSEELGDVAIIQRAYRREANRPPLQIIVICGRGRRSLHPPGACYVGAGQDLLEESQRTIDTVTGRLRFERLVVGTSGTPHLVALYTFTDGTTTTPDYAEHQREALTHGRVIWTQLHFAAPWQGSVEATEQMLVPFIVDAWPEIRKTLPKAETGE